MKPAKHILPIIVLAQFCCTSLWFAGNGVMAALTETFQLPEGSLAHLTSAVQFGFISGTLVFAILTIADRFSPSRVFLVSALAGALFNGLMAVGDHSLWSLLSLRFLTGFFLAGIYPVGMKIAADYFDKGLGKSLGYLVGALVLGTAFPHLLKSVSGALPWTLVILTTSGLAATGGLLMALLVPDGPFRKPSQQVDVSAFFSVFRDRKFRAAAFGYFGHMWELYAFWAFVPIILQTYVGQHGALNLNPALLAFLIIAIGGPACVLGGYLSQRLGAQLIATIALMISGICCLLSPLAFQLSSPVPFLVFLFLWGMVVIADSPLFSTLVASSAPAEKKGTALTIVNCIGFAITIGSIQLLNGLLPMLDHQLLYLFLAAGPLFGLAALRWKA